MFQKYSSYGQLHLLDLGIVMGLEAATGLGPGFDSPQQGQTSLSASLDTIQVLFEKHKIA